MIQDSTRAKLRLGLAVLCACATARFYFYLVRIVPKVGSAEPTGTGEVLPWVKLLTHQSLQSIQQRTVGFAYTAQYIACIAALFALYGVMLWLARGIRSRWFSALAAGASAGFMWLLLMAPAMLSTDTYAYSYYGRLLSFYGVDAHSTAPANTLSDPFLCDGWYQFVPSVYGPLWTVISGGLTLAGGGHVGATIFMFRALEAVLALGSGALIWVIMKELAPRHAAEALVLFLWNPLVVTESALGGHNDTCMMFLALLALWLHLRGYKACTVVALALSALVKVITAPLVPLYMLMTLRKNSGWKEGGWFTIRAGLGTAAAVALSVLCARMNPNGLTAHTASSPQFFENNYHELLFKGLRRLLGEPADTIEAPMDFRNYWVATSGPATLHAGTSNKSITLTPLNADQPLLVVSDEDSDDWLRVYDPTHRIQGYIDWSHLMVIDDPPIAETDPTAKRMSGWPPDWPTVAMANRLIRITTWSLLIAFGLLAAWKTTDFDSFIWWGTAFFLASQLLVFTKIWPWYAVWPLAYGALKPGTAVTRLAIILSGGMSTLYVLLDYSASDRWTWINECRSIPTIVLPVLLFAVLQWGPGPRWFRAAPEGTE